jgi:hypothetical protein
MVLEAVERYRRVYGLERVGPHLKVAEREFAGLRSRFRQRDVDGVIGDVHGWRECPACERVVAWRGPRRRTRLERDVAEWLRQHTTSPYIRFPSNQLPQSHNALAFTCGPA